MNLPRSSIVRLMASIGLIGLALAVLRAWAWTGDDDWFRIGELAPLSLIALCGLVLSILTSGRLRRFYGGVTITGLVVGLAFWVAPISFRNTVLHRVVFPLDARFGPRSPGDLATELGWSLSWVFERPENSRLRPTRNPFVSRESQVALGCLELAVAVLGGLFAAMPGPWKARPTVTSDA